MRTLLRRSMLAALVLAVSATGLAAVAVPASAQSVQAGTLTFGGDPGDYISGGADHSYDTAKGDAFTVNSSGNATVSIFMSGSGGSFWSVDLDAPNGQTLTAGTTYTATRYPFNGSGAGFDLSGDGRGCNQLDATFTVLAASFGDNGYVERFEASFEQHCEGAPPAARGEVRVVNPPPPAPLGITVAVSDQGTVSPVSGRARVNGDVTCTRPVTVFLNGDLSQVVRQRVVRGPLSTTVACTPGAPVPWTTIVTPNGDRPFVEGRAEAFVRGTAHDDIFNRDVESSVTVVTRLRKSAPALTDF